MSINFSVIRLLAHSKTKIHEGEKFILMALLNYDVLKQSGYSGYILRNAPEKIMQFGEGNFLRAFVNYFFDVANE